MNLKEGRVGMQETTSLALMGIAVSGLFYPNAVSTYRYGNASYMSAFLSYLFLFVLFFLIKQAMIRSRSRHFGELLNDAFGGVFGRAAALSVSLFLVASSVLPLARFVLLIKRFVFPSSDLAPVAVYLLVVLVFLPTLGFESLARTARLLVIPFFLSFLVPLIQAGSSYEVYRLFPLPMENSIAILRDSVGRVAYGLPAILSLLTVAKGAHGIENVSRCANRSILIGGTVVTAVLFCIGLTFAYADLQELFSPLYRLLLTQRSGIELRTDKLILFVWITIGLVAVSFYLYSASLLFCRAFKIADVRVPSAAFASIAVSFMLLAAGERSLLLQGIDLVAKRLHWISIVPLFAVLITFFKRRRIAA